MTITTTVMMALSCDFAAPSPTCAKHAEFSADMASNCQRRAKESGWRFVRGFVRVYCPECAALAADMRHAGHPAPAAITKK